MKTVERWDVFELTMTGKMSENPFLDFTVQGTFRGAAETKTVDGFFDGVDENGKGVYKIRFMPSFVGDYTYEVSGSFSDEVFSGSFTATEAGEGNHGPVRVERKYHFAYEDGTPYISIGTTCYAWLQQEEALQEKTLETLKKSPFNKIRFCVFPKHYIHNLKEPIDYPYVDGHKEGLDTETPEKSKNYPPTEHPIDHFNYLYPNVAHFQRFDRQIRNLRDMGIEADIIMMHPYDRWQFSHMTRQADDLYWNYCVARWSAYRNVWWSLANEYDLLPQKKLSDWERFADILVRKDCYQHLRSIHACMTYYEYTRPWITHASLQRLEWARTTELTDAFRTQFGKPVVWDEICYEGDIDQGWGNITGEELVRRFWEASLRGGYAGHGETFEDPVNDILWWSHGGELHGESAPRLKFLAKILAETPGKYLMPGRAGFDECCGVPEKPGGAENPDYEIHYYGITRPRFKRLMKEPGVRYTAEAIDTWNMTVTALPGTYTGGDEIPLSGNQYMALRLRKVQ